MTQRILTHGLNSDCPKVKAGEWSRCEGHELDDMKRVVETFPRVGGDYIIQDRTDARSCAIGMENAAKAVKDDIRQGQYRDALRHSMQLAQSLVELQRWLQRQPQ